MDQLTQTFKALSHKNRLKIIRLLLEREYICCHADNPDECTLEEPECDFGELIESLEIHKSTLSHHLKELKYAGLIVTEKRGRSLSIRVSREKLNQIKEFFDVEKAVQI